MPRGVVSLLTPSVGPRDHTLGPPDAAVTLVEYGDFECPLCGRAYPQLKRALQQLGGKVRFVFRHFPLHEEHPHAQHAAEVAEAAAAQGKFWEMHDLLYQRQGALGDEDLVQYARELGLDAERVRRELAAHVHAERVRADYVSGTWRGGIAGRWSVVDAALIARAPPPPRPPPPATARRGGAPRRTAARRPPG